MYTGLPVDDKKITRAIESRDELLNDWSNTTYKYLTRATRTYAYEDVPVVSRKRKAPTRVRLTHLAPETEGG